MLALGEYVGEGTLFDMIKETKVVDCRLVNLNIHLAELRLFYVLGIVEFGKHAQKIALSRQDSIAISLLVQIQTHL